MPNRLIKESICTSDNLDKLSWFEEVFFFRLIVNCDDFGRMDARPAIIRSRLFPLKTVTDTQVKQALQSLRSAGIIDLYEVDGRSFLQMRTWEKHQNVRAKKSKYPAPNSGMQASEIICKQMHANVPVIQSNPNPIQSESNRACDDDDEIVYSAVQLSHNMDAMESQWGKMGFVVSPDDREKMEHLLMDDDIDTILEAMKVASDKKPRNIWPYIRKTLENWRTRGRDVRAEQKGGAQDGWDDCPTF